MWIRLTQLILLSSAFAVAVIGVSGPVLAEPYKVTEVKDGGTIKGVATWNGDVPPLQKIRGTTDMDTCGDVVPSPALQVNPQNKGVRSVLVYLERVEQGKAPAAKYTLHMGKDQTNKVPDTEVCQFKERIFPFVRTQPTAMINFDKLFHYVTFLDEKNVPILVVNAPPGGINVEHNLLRDHGGGVTMFQCDIHSHMNGYRVGFPHPYFAVTDAEGKFEITGVPPGEYTLVAWHEGYKIVRRDLDRPSYDRPHVQAMQISVKPKGTAAVEFQFPARAVAVEPAEAQLPARTGLASVPSHADQVRVLAQAFQVSPQVVEALWAKDAKQDMDAVAFQLAHQAQPPAQTDLAGVPSHRVMVGALAEAFQVPPQVVEELWAKNAKHDWEGVALQLAHQAQAPAQTNVIIYSPER